MGRMVLSVLGPKVVLYKIIGGPPQPLNEYFTLPVIGLRQQTENWGMLSLDNHPVMYTFTEKGNIPRNTPKFCDFCYFNMTYQKIIEGSLEVVLNTHPPPQPSQD